MDLVYYSYALYDQQNLNGKLQLGFMDERHKFKERNLMDVTRTSRPH